MVVLILEFHTLIADSNISMFSEMLTLVSISKYFSCLEKLLNNPKEDNKYQLDGFHFLSNNIIGNFGASPGSGGILSYSMWLGKTVQLCTLFDILRQYT